MNTKNAVIGSAVVLSCALSALAFSLISQPVSRASEAVPTPVATTPSVPSDTSPTAPVATAPTTDAPVPSGPVEPPRPTTTATPHPEPTYQADPQVPYIAPVLDCPAWTSPGVLDAHGNATSCLWNMPGAGGKLVLTACESEDSVNCYWDATKRGNGIGESFININGVYFYAK